MWIINCCGYIVWCDVVVKFKGCDKVVFDMQVCVDEFRDQCQICYVDYLCVVIICIDFDNCIFVDCYVVCNYLVCDNIEYLFFV